MDDRDGLGRAGGLGASDLASLSEPGRLSGRERGTEGVRRSALSTAERRCRRRTVLDLLRGWKGGWSGLGWARERSEEGREGGCLTWWMALRGEGACRACKRVRPHA